MVNAWVVGTEDWAQALQVADKPQFCGQHYSLILRTISKTQ